MQESYSYLIGHISAEALAFLDLAVAIVENTKNSLVGGIANRCSNKRVRVEKSTERNKANARVNGPTMNEEARA